MNSDKISIKGIRQGLLVTLGEGDWRAALHALETRLDVSPSFFGGGRIAIDVGSRELTSSEIERIQTLLARHQVELWALISTHTVTKKAVQELGLVTEFTAPSPPESESAPDEESKITSNDGLVVRRTLRSGQSLRHPSHIVIIGDINPGAEVVAGGDIVVWGRVRGVVHAGALGDDQAVICGLDLMPMQLRIAGHIARSPEDERRESVPEIAWVRAGQIEAAPWRAFGARAARAVSGK